MSKNKKDLDPKDLEKILSFLGKMTDEQLMKIKKIINKQMGVSEHFNWAVKWHIKKFLKADYELLGANAVPVEVVDFKENIALDAGVNMLWKLFAGVSDSSVVPFNNTNAVIEVGSSDMPENVTNTGVITKLDHAKMSDGYPKIEDRSIIFQAVFDSEDAIGKWNEVSIRNGTNANSVALNRRVKDMGEKASGIISTIQVEVAGLSVPNE